MNVSSPVQSPYLLALDNSAPAAQTKRQLATAVQAINQSDLLGPGRELMLSLDPGTRRSVVQIVNSDTREILDQVPSEQVLEMQAALAKP
jgi:uncharacterized FlaG/YvyC family protein